MTAAFKHPPVHSPWFTFAEQAPWEPGVYEVETNTGRRRFAYWGGVTWMCTAETLAEAYEMRGYATCCAITRWRGIVPPSRLPRFVSETWPKSVARVPSLAAFADKPVFPSITDVCTLLDCMPGYDLMQVLHTTGNPAVALFRRRDPS